MLTNNLARLKENLEFEKRKISGRMANTSDSLNGSINYERPKRRTLLN